MSICDGVNSALAFKAGTSAGNTDVCDLLDDSLEDVREIYDDTESLIGGRQENVADTICLKQAPGGSFTFRPRYDDISKVFALALGSGTTTLTPIATGEMPVFTTVVDKAGAKVQKYTGCAVEELTFSSEQNDPAKIQVDLFAKDCTDGTLTADYTGIAGVNPMLHDQLTMTGDIAAGLNIYKYQLHIKNNIADDLYANSKTRHTFQGQKFDCDLELELDLTTSLATAWNTAYKNKTALTLTATYTDGVDTIEFAFSGIITSPLPKVSSTGLQRATVTFDGKAVKSAAGAITTNKLSVTIS